MQKIDRNGRVAIYHQVAMSLERQIAAGRWSVGEKLPSERVLAEIFGTTRTTMRQALGVLEHSGILLRKRPDGTIVRAMPPKLAPTLSIPVSFVRSMVTSGHSIDLITVDVRTAPCLDDTVANALGTELGGDTAILSRLMRSESVPLAFTESILDVNKFPGFEDLKLVDNSIHQTLWQHYGVRIAEANHTIECLPAPEKIAHHLNIESGSFVLKLDSCYLDNDSLPVEYVHTYWRSDVVKLSLKSGPSSD